MAERVITICSTKGGVGKTTLTANLGGLLAELGQSVLLIDADIQPTLSSFYPLKQRATYGLTALISTGNTAGTVTTTTTGCDLIVSDDPEGCLQDLILHAPDGRVRLRHALTALTTYDTVLIDTQGAVGPLQDAAVLAADRLISPIPPDILSAREFVRGTLGMLERLQPMRRLGIEVAPLAGLIYRLDRTIDARRIAAELRRELGNVSRADIHLLNVVIPATVAYREAATARVPVHQWEPKRRGPTLSARDTMLSLVRELFPNLRSAATGDEDTIERKERGHDS